VAHSSLHLDYNEEEKSMRGYCFEVEGVRWVHIPGYYGAALLCVAQQLGRPIAIGQDAFFGELEVDSLVYS
jgi:hypothetical protein